MIIITEEHRQTAKNVNSNPVQYRRELATHILNRYKNSITPPLEARLKKV